MIQAMISWSYLLDRKMTPAINLAKKRKIPHIVHQYQHDPNHTSYGLEAAEVLGQDPNTVFKTLLFCINEFISVLTVIPL